MNHPRTRLAALAFLAATAVGNAWANPAVIFDMGGKFDKSFNEAAYNGAEPLEEGNRQDLSRVRDRQRDAARTGDPAHGRPRREPDRRDRLLQGSAIEKAAKEFPELQFAIIDSVVDLPNVQSVVFKEHEGSFLVGMMAAMASKTGTTRDLGKLNAQLDRLEALMSSKSGAASGKRKGARQGNGVVPAGDEVLKTIKQSKQGLKFADIQAKTGFPDKKNSPTSSSA